MKPDFKRVCIIGVGLIGGSLAWGIKENRIAEEVVGFFRRRKSLEQALKKGIVNKGYLSLRKAIAGSDLVIFSTPIYEIFKLGKEIKRYISSDDVVITDVGSTKSMITKELSRIYPNYIGSHPLAGSEKKGCDFARPDLFRNKITIITPVKGCQEELINLVKEFWERLGSKVIIMAPEIHDKLLCRISHLPHLLMYVLMNLVNKGEPYYTASGFRDATRIAASEPKLWSEIFVSNKVNILKETNSFLKILSKYKKAIQGNKEEMLLSLLTDASSKRRQLE